MREMRREDIARRSVRGESKGRVRGEEKRREVKERRERARCSIRYRLQFG